MKLKVHDKAPILFSILENISVISNVPTNLDTLYSKNDSTEITWIKQCYIETDSTTLDHI